MSLLYDNNYIEGMNNNIENTKKEFSDSLDKSMRWELVKNNIIEFSQWFAKRKANETKNKLDILCKKFNSLEKQLRIINLSSDKAISLIKSINAKLDKVKEELNKIENQRVQRAMLHSQTIWFQESGKNSKYFLGLEKCKAKNRTMSAVRLENGQVSHDTRVILEKQREFYTK